MSPRRAAALWCLAALALLAAAPARAAGVGSAFDYYILALSWSPAFCSKHPDDQAECGARRGFIVHGLWPQYAGGGGPTHCGSTERPDPQTIERAKLAMVDERLVRHEWLAHGTCTGLSPRDYFLTMIHAVGRLSIPAQFDGEESRSMTASQVVSAFVKANPSMPPRALALHCRGAQLEEVRICLTPDLSPQPCGADVHTRCRRGPLDIPAANRH